MKIVNLMSGDRQWPFTEAKLNEAVQKTKKNNGKECFYVCITNDYPGFLGNRNVCFIPVGEVRTEAEFAKEFIKKGGVASVMFPLFELDKKMHDAKLVGKELPCEIVVASSVPAASNFFSVANTISVKPSMDEQNADDPYVPGSDYGVFFNFVANAQYLLDTESGVELPICAPDFDAKVERTGNRIIAECKKAEDADEGFNC